MYELAAFVRYSQGVHKEDARQHWNGLHGVKVVQIPGVTRYVQNNILEPVEEGSLGTVPFDGYLCQWYPDQQSVTLAQASPEWQAVASDAETFLDPTSVMGPIEEQVVRDGAPGTLKVVAVFEPGPAGDDAASKLRKAVLESSRVSRCVENRRVEQADWNLSYGTFSELWMADGREDVRAIVGRLAVASSGASNRGSGGMSWMAIVEERVVTG
jgi:uncharacterized protein (TIGR02118 family)